MRFAYADPPYLGCGQLYKQHHEESLKWNTVEAHAELIRSLEQFDGWALSLSSVTLHTLLPLCPPKVRVAAWVKPFAVFRPNVNPAYAWEPVIFSGSRKRERYEDTVRDWCSANITLKKGLVGAKPPAFADWILDLLGVTPWDEFIDLFPGTGAMTAAFERKKNA